MSDLQNNTIHSEAVVTYNHEIYFTQALDRILIQKPNFAFEVVIVDDCSKNKTTTGDNALYAILENVCSVLFFK